MLAPLSQVDERAAAAAAVVAAGMQEDYSYPQSKCITN